MDDNEQKLIDIMFEIGIVINEERKYFYLKNAEKRRQRVVEWISEKLSLCGFYVQPCGMSHGVLCEKPEEK